MRLFQFLYAEDVCGWRMTCAHTCEHSLTLCTLRLAQLNKIHGTLDGHRNIVPDIIKQIKQGPTWSKQLNRVMLAYGIEIKWANYYLTNKLIWKKYRTQFKPCIRNGNKSTMKANLPKTTKKTKLVFWQKNPINNKTHMLTKMI